jgi:SAM-dependent methyltransferase
MGIQIEHCLYSGKFMKHALKKIMYHGREHYCSVCCAHVRTWIHVGLKSEVFNKFKMVGAGWRKQGCPVCHCSDRDRLMLEFFQSYFLSQPEIHHQSVLHIAPEKYVTHCIQKQIGHYVKGDAFEEGYRYDADTQKMDIQAIPYGEETFDTVIANHVLEHVPNDIQALQEIWRVLKPNGYAILQVPMALDLETTIEADSHLSIEDRVAVTGQFDHLRLYGIDFFDKLTQMGFSLDLWKSDRDAFHWGFNPEERIIRVQKN